MDIRQAARDPVAACRKIVRRVRNALLERGFGDASFWRRFEAALEVSSADREAWLAEADAVEREIAERWEAASGKVVRTGLLESACRRALYVAARSTGVRRAVETGVANGSSSLVLLSAIAKNGGGRLWSLEPAGPSEFVPNGFEVGWLVPDRLRGDWTLIRRPSLEALPDVWKETGPIDLFFHDSEHSLEIMRAEYEAAWPNIRREGWLASDDVFFNDAFEAFAGKHGLEGWVWRTRLGLLRKP